MRRLVVTRRAPVFGPLRTTGRWRRTDALEHLAAFRHHSTMLDHAAHEERHLSDGDRLLVSEAEALGQRGALGAHGGPVGVERARERLDVHGHRVTPIFGHRESAQAAFFFPEEDSDVELNWATLEAAGHGLHEGMTPRERRQWQQEINELKAVDDAVEQFKRQWLSTDVAAEGGPDAHELRSPTKNEMIGRTQTQRQLARFAWFSTLRAELLHELRAAAGLRGEHASDAEAEVANARRLKELSDEGVGRPVLMSLVQPPPRELAIRVVRGKILNAYKEGGGGADEPGGGGSGGSGPQRVEWAKEQLSATLEELQQLPAEASKKQVDAVLEPAADGGEGGWLQMRLGAGATRGLVHCLTPAEVGKLGKAELRRALEERGEPTTGEKREMQRRLREYDAPRARKRREYGLAERQALMGARQRTGRQLRESFDRQLETRLRQTCDRLAVLTVHEVASSVLLADDRRVKTTELCIGLGSLVQLQYGRDALMFSSQQCSQNWRLLQLFGAQSDGPKSQQPKPPPTTTAGPPTEGDEDAAAATDDDALRRRRWLSMHPDKRLSHLTRREAERWHGLWPNLNKTRKRHAYLTKAARGDFDLAAGGAKAAELAQIREHREALEREMAVAGAQAGPRSEAARWKAAHRMLREAEAEAANEVARDAAKRAKSFSLPPEDIIPAECLGPVWDRNSTCRVGAYLASRLLKHALFSDEHAKPCAPNHAELCAPHSTAPTVDGAASPDAALAGLAGLAGLDADADAEADEAPAELQLARAAAWPAHLSASRAELQASREVQEELRRGQSKLKKAFALQNKWTAHSGGAQPRRVSYVQADPRLYTELVTGDLCHLRNAVHPEEMPMLAPPLAWCKEDAPGLDEAGGGDGGGGELPAGGFFHCNAAFVRTAFKGHTLELRRTPAEQLQPVFESLDALAATGWRVNRWALDLTEALWDAQPGGACPPELREGVAFLPDRVDRPPPPPLAAEAAVDTDGMDAAAAQRARYVARREHERAEADVRKHNAELHSMRCTAQLKLDVARRLRDEHFYYPYNLDFRGRAYPTSPHLTHLGDDLARGLLTFAEKRPLGPRGLRWLKVHLANLYGVDKLPLEERVAWADGLIERGVLRAVHDEPLGSRAQEWWQQADNALQTLAVAREVHLASCAPDPAAYLSDVPVHQDGSCNGLQHYAALLKDRAGGEQVNLTPSEQPQDVYAGVRALVAQKVEDDAAAGDALAGRLVGLVSRKVVKQTVMTSVYGVTYVGARQQIQNRLEEVKELKACTETEHFAMAGYLAKLTMQSLGTVFSGATDAMGWMASAASQIAKESGKPVQWTTPLGLPVLQPYMKPEMQRVKTVLAQLSLTREMDPTDARARVNSMKQRSAFSPNYVHSIDSTHMLMTAVECRRRGLVFAAVHDSYWTHACDVDEMNEVLRDKFVELHSQPLLEQVLDSFRQRYPEVAWDDAPKLQLPKPGDLDLEQVRKSTYFFA